MHFLSKLLALSLSAPSRIKEFAPDHQLHWEELGEILMNLKDQGVPDLVLMNARLPTLPLSRLSIKESPGRGRGVFAAQDCQEGDLLTCYPGDLILQPTGFTPDPKEVGIQDDQLLQDLMSRYCIGMTDDCAILGLPERDQDMAYVGHFINDACQEPPSNEEELEAYLEESQAKANAQLIPLENLHMVALATRDIQKDEEVFVFYGPIYWMEHTSTWKGQVLEP
ncbi:expressed unknown protein [Seminavis robusta]|uniref:SET domain-containing protein n=1 Tax=Seminavis robusta TaxID=568900 RepID=A0A9N8F195_9STRA|nr:expressed unknown protein [Seminavis robusta]|eukprot:Sro2588_g331980.1 n/a (224) ;mRNA; r:4168-4839